MTQGASPAPFFLVMAVSVFGSRCTDEQDFAICNQTFPGLIARPLAAQFMLDGAIAMFEFVDTDEGVRVLSERHYELVSHDQLTVEELRLYSTNAEPP